MSFTPEQLATPLGQLASAIYAPDPPNPEGVAVLGRIIATAMATSFSSPLTIEMQTRDWTHYDASTQTMSGATFWTTGQGVILGDYEVKCMLPIGWMGKAAIVRFFQDPEWVPPIETAAPCGSIACVFIVHSMAACRIAIDTGLF